jgi:hypothetical protein
MRRVGISVLQGGALLSFKSVEESICVAKISPEIGYQGGLVWYSVALEKVLIEVWIQK